MSLASQVGLLATRVGVELKSIRTNYVPSTLRGPIGGVNSSTGVSGTVNLDPTLSNQYRIVATGDVAIASMAAGADGQRLLLEANASSGQRIITFDPAYELSNAVPTRAFTIPSGQWAYIALICRSGTWRLISAEPQVVPDYSTPSVWQPADHALLAWSYDPLLTTTTYVPAANGQMFGTAIKVSSGFTTVNCAYALNTAGSGFTAGRNALGLFNAAGTLIAQTPDQSTAWAAGAGTYNTSWTASVALSAGFYYVNFLVTATTPPQIAAATLPNSYAIRYAKTPGSYRGYWYSGSYTSLPSPRPAPSGPDRPMWVGLA